MPSSSGHGKGKAGSQKSPKDGVLAIVEGEPVIKKRPAASSLAGSKKVMKRPSAATSTLTVENVKGLEREAEAQNQQLNTCLKGALTMLEKTFLAVSKAEFLLERADSLTPAKQRMKDMTLQEVATVKMKIGQAKDAVVESMCKHVESVHTNIKVDRLQAASTALDEWKDLKSSVDMIIGKHALANDAGSQKALKD